MRKLRFIGWLCLGAVVALTGCTHGSSHSYTYHPGKKTAHAKRKQPAKTPTSRPVSKKNQHTVKKGETMYSIAWQYGYDVRDVARWNRIRAPYTIYPQQKIRLKPPKSTASKKPWKAQRPASAKPATRPTKKPRTDSKNTKKISWQWPTKGKIIGKYSSRDSGKKGLDIAGRNGQRVYAAARGIVVYSGGGLRGYGKLIIIKHNDTYFSAYAHSSRLFVTEGKKVTKGQHIADMGSSEAQRVMLHFEVRRNGKPVDPLRYLPRRR